MKSAINEAEKALEADEVPVGAIIVKKTGETLSSSFNTVEKDKSSIMHAEIKAIMDAQKKLKNWRLEGCTLYVTLEPCIMCCGAIVLSRITRLVYGTKDYKGGMALPIINGRIEVVSGVMKKESEILLKTFFQSKRNKSRVSIKI
ncbi:nucleoside deaminase [Candidatus Acidulodesulfobacterium sp. H_13]|uniref:nucleoside deaminase n=1 Tax=Candidatus Acidulodesulfobacterium sp. H_13 TaxID=3395470 RepID=UPI003AF67BBF